MATLQELAEISGGRLIRADDPDLVVTDIGLNAQALPEGGLFAGVPGLHVHGAQFADSSSAAAVLTDHDGVEKVAREDLPIIVVDDVRAVLGAVSSAVYDHPSRDLTVIGITGTAGKTTTSYMVEAALLHHGISTGLIGTTGTRINGEKVPSTLTTPEAPNLQALFAMMKKRGVTHVVMEVSSHAIALGRVLEPISPSRDLLICPRITSISTPRWRIISRRRRGFSRKIRPCMRRQPSYALMMRGGRD